MSSNEDLRTGGIMEYTENEPGFDRKYSHPSPTEDEFTKNIEDYTGSIPSSVFLGVAVGAMGLSLMFQATGNGKWGNFIAQWVPTWLIFGLYSKLVKLEGHDSSDRGAYFR
jgi:hypothetical protein